MQKTLFIPIILVAIIVLAFVMWFRRDVKLPRTAILTENAPVPIGAYSQAIQTGNVIFVSGQIAINPKTNVLVNDSIIAETKQVLENIEAILSAAGTDMQHIVKTTIYLTNIGNFKKVNEVYGQHFKKNPPARETVEVCNLPKNASIEISVIAVK